MLWLLFYFCPVSFLWLQSIFERLGSCWKAVWEVHSHFLHLGFTSRQCSSPSSSRRKTRWDDKLQKRTKPGYNSRRLLRPQWPFGAFGSVRDPGWHLKVPLGVWNLHNTPVKPCVALRCKTNKALSFIKRDRKRNFHCALKAPFVVVQTKSEDSETPVFWKHNIKLAEAVVNIPQCTVLKRLL